MTCSNNNTLPKRFWAKVNKTASCWEWTGARSPQGYGLIRTKTGQSKAHRVAFELTKGCIPPGLMVRHQCDNPGCVNPAHLAVGSASDNANDRSVRGRSADRRGERHPMAKLNSAMVGLIRHSSLSGKMLADIFDISQALVSRIKGNKIWKHL